MLALLAQTLPTTATSVPTTAPTLTEVAATLPTVATTAVAGAAAAPTPAAPIDPTLVYGIPIAVGVIAATGPLLNAAIVWWYQARATRISTYLTAFKTAKETELVSEEDKAWGKGLVAQLVADSKKKPSEEFPATAMSFGIATSLVGAGGTLAASLFSLPAAVNVAFGWLNKFGLVVAFVGLTFLAQQIFFLLAQMAFAFVRLWHMRRKSKRLKRQVETLTARADDMEKRNEALAAEAESLKAETSKIVAESARSKQQLEGLVAESARLKVVQDDLRAKHRELIEAAEARKKEPPQGR